jgi:hypothetical protein
MKRLFILATLFSPAALLFAQQRPSPQPLPSKKEATVIMQKAFAAMDLTAPGSPPFQLKARVHFEFTGEHQDGTYTLNWFRPDQCREDFSLQGDGAETDIATGDKIYILRTSSTPALSLLSTQAILRPSRPGTVAWDLRVNRVYSVRMNGRNEICIDSKRDLEKERACFDNGTAEPAFTQDWITEGSFPQGLARENFIFLNKRHFPRHLVVQTLDEKLDLRLDSIINVEGYVVDLFDPPPASIVREWCADPVESGTLSAPALMSVLDLRQILAYYVLVKPDGSIERSEALRPLARKVDNEVSVWLRTTKFPIHLCGGKPIEYGRIYQLDTGVTP